MPIPIPTFYVKEKLGDIIGSPDMRKKRIAQWIWKEHGWERVVAIETVRNVLNKHGLWKRLSQHTMMLRIKGWMVYLQTSMRGDLCV
ncbi:MAG: hypothetical protein WAV32_02535 [Halobacteriota archaeon]